jgi:DNA polymerase III subunit alpha
MKFTPNYKNHELYQSTLYLELLRKLDSQKLTDYSKDNEKFQLLLSIIQNRRTLSPNHLNYLKEELEASIVNILNFEDHLLTYHEIAMIDVKRNILSCVGRGSAAGSLVCYSLDISKLDPLEYDLRWDRFVPFSPKVIDIDLDVPDRSYIINYLNETYPGKIALLGSSTNHTIKSAFIKIMESKVAQSDLFKYTKFLKTRLEHNPYNGIAEVLHQLKINKNLIKHADALTDTISEINRLAGLDNNGSKENFMEIVETSHELTHLFDFHKEQKELIYNLIGTPKEEGIHACAIILDDNLSQYNLSERANKFNLPIITDVDWNSLFKVDLLNLRSLNKELFLDINIDLSLQEINKAIKEKAPNHFFQGKYITSYPQVMDSTSITSIYDFALFSALYRPLTVKNINYKMHNQKCPESLREAFSKTKGWIVFQEDLLALAESRNIPDRRAFLGDMINNRNNSEYKEFFDIEELAFLDRFSKYAFNKAHAVAYAKITFMDVYNQI